MTKQYKAVALLSGGLDSLLATKIILEQGIHVEALNFVIGFGGKINLAIAVAEQLGIKLHIVDVVEEFKPVVINPQHGYGAHLNPCLDCKIFMVNKAKHWLAQHNFDFIITGEVIGQRPKSQRRDTMPVVAQESGADDLLLRPLCAKRLSLTLPEREGWVNRELLYGFTGRSRKPQLELVKKFKITNHPQPAGGCLLTEKHFCQRLLDIWQSRGKKDYDQDDLALLQVGRHLRPKPSFKLIIGRDEAESSILENYMTKFTGLKTISHGGPVALLDGSYNDEDIKLSAQIVARFSSGRSTEQVTIQLRQLNDVPQLLKVKPVLAKAIMSEWYI